MKSGLKLQDFVYLRPRATETLAGDHEKGVRTKRNTALRSYSFVSVYFFFRKAAAMSKQSVIRLISWQVSASKRWHL